MEDQEKAKSKSVSLLPEVWERVEARAEERFQGNRSKYIQSLIDADLAGATASGAPEGGERIIENLAEKWRHDIADKIKAALPDGLDQRALLGAILDELPAFLRAASINFARDENHHEESQGFWGRAKHEYECRLFPKSNADEILMSYAALAAESNKPGDRLRAELYAAPLMTPTINRMAEIMSDGKWSAGTKKPGAKSPVSTIRPKNGSNLPPKDEGRTASA